MQSKLLDPIKVLYFDLLTEGSGVQIVVGGIAVLGDPAN